jgi:glycosyltransferase involved in cell wall biosynthesis
MNQILNTPTLTIIIPAYNEAEYIATCLDSVARQTVQADEVILVDNNSSDETVKIARRYPFVKVIHESQQGLIAARNRGFREARGTIVARIDADTKLIPEWTKLVMQYLGDHPEIAGVTGRAIFYDFPAKNLMSWLHTAIYYKAQGVIAGMTILWGANMAIRKSAAMEIIDECPPMSDVNEDIYMSLIMKKHRMRNVFLPKLSAEVSLQRGNLNPIFTVKYLSMWEKNYFHLGMPVRGFFIVLLKCLVLFVALPLGAIYHLIHGRP